MIIGYKGVIILLFLVGRVDVLFLIGYKRVYCLLLMSSQHAGKVQAWQQ
jgi:hypothetical protein